MNSGKKHNQCYIQEWNCTSVLKLQQFSSATNIKYSRIFHIEPQEIKRKCMSKSDFRLVKEQNETSQQNVYDYEKSRCIIFHYVLSVWCTLYSP